jgi:hypothetical protein
MHHLVLVLFNLINTTWQPTVEPIVRHHDMVVKTTDSIVQKVLTATPTPRTSSTTYWLELQKVQSHTTNNCQQFHGFFSKG